MSRAHKAKHAPKAPTKAPAAKPRRRWLPATLVALVALAALGAWLVARRSGVEPAVAIPAPDTSGMEPPVVELVARARAAVLRSPESADAWGWYAAVLDVHELHRHAEQAYRRAMQLAPEDRRFPYNLAIALESVGAELDEVLALYRGFEAREPRYPPVHFRIGLILARQGQLEAAAAAHRRALELEPGLTIARRSLGQVLLALDQPQAALAELEQVAAAAPRDGPTHAALAQAHARLGNEAAATAAVERARGLPELLHVVDALRFVVVQLGASSRLASARAAQRAEQGDYAGAAQDLELVARSRPDDPSVHERLAEAYTRLGKSDRALEHRVKARRLVEKR